MSPVTPHFLARCERDVRRARLAYDAARRAALSAGRAYRAARGTPGEWAAGVASEDAIRDALRARIDLRDARSWVARCHERGVEKFANLTQAGKRSRLAGGAS